MRELEPEAVEAVLKAERETCNHPPKTIGKIVLENTTLYNEGFQTISSGVLATTTDVYKPRVF